MALTNTTYTKTASFSPNTAINLVYNWVVNGGIILSGQGTLTITYQFTSIGSKTIVLTITNNCSVVTASNTYDVCNLITGLTINGLGTVVQNTEVSYTFTTTGGTLIITTWGIGGGNAFIVSGWDTNTITINVGTQLFTLILSVADCNYNSYLTTKNVNLVLACTLIGNVILN